MTSKSGSNDSYMTGAIVGLRMLSTAISITVGVLLSSFLAYSITFRGKSKNTRAVFAL